MAHAESDLLRSSLDLLILKALSWGPMHGYAVSEWIESATDTVLLVEEGTLYPALHRLEGRGWITAEWGVSDRNRRAKFYKLSAAGRARFRAESSVWHRHADAIAGALRQTSAAAAEGR
jgi:transcriptional regulator